ncbi:MAG TPA: DUF305 domain-containing protein [Paenirhodobacter sp.]
MNRISRTRILALTLSVVMVPVLATAQDSTAATGHDMSKMVMDSSATADAAPSTLAFMQATEKMHSDMAAPYTGDADVDFIRGMIPHHEGAIAMAKVALEYGTDPDVRKLAEKVISDQQGEVDWMNAWLAQHAK